MTLQKLDAAVLDADMVACRQTVSAAAALVQLNLHL